MYDLIIFDLGNVLVDVDFPDLVRRLAARSPRSEQDITTFFASGELKRDHDRGIVTTGDFCDACAAWLEIPGMGPREFLDVWPTVFSPTAGAKNLMDSWPATVKRWLLSDTDPVHYGRCYNDYPYIRGFDRYLLSCRMGRVKTDPGAFEPVAELVRQEGARALFLDDRQVIVEQALRAGIEARVFVRWDEATLALVTGNRHQVA